MSTPPKLSRRQFLFGSLGVAAAGAVGAFEWRQHPNLLHAMGIEHSPDRSVAKAQVKTESGTLKSAHMPDTVQWMYSVPSVEPVATVFCLHGRGGSHATVFDALRLQDFVAQANLLLAVAAVDGGFDNYWHRRADGSDAMSMLIDEFIPLIEARTKTSKRALYGWSMGGYGTLLAAATHPSMFSAVTALSPALWMKSSDSAPGAFDDAADFRANDVFAKRDVLRNLPVHISCGTSDPFYKATRSFVSGLPNAQSDFGNGFHDDAYWRSVTPASLRFIADQVA